MSTRCQIGFFAKDEAKPKDFQALIYRHSDGYPGKEDGSEYGVLADLVPFLRKFQAERGLDDTEYAAARTLQHLTNNSDDQAVMMHKEYPSLGSKREIETLGFGISSDFHGDIEYFYAVKPTKLDVYRVRGWGEEQQFQLVETIDIPRGKRT